MTTSGTYAFAPTVGDLTMMAWRRGTGKKRVEMDVEALTDARLELNFMFTDWANKGPNLWTVDKQSIPLAAGAANVMLDPSIADLLDGWLTVSGVDMPLASISRTDYANISNKAQPGRPSVYWYAKTTAPNVTFWQVPDVSATYTFNYFRYRFMQDAALTNGQTPDLPRKWLDAATWGLAARLAAIYAPDRVQAAAMAASAAYDTAAGEDVENAPLSARPQLGGYFR